jgi:hypothetical protein
MPIQKERINWITIAKNAPFQIGFLVTLVSEDPDVYKYEITITGGRYIWYGNGSKFVRPINGGTIDITAAIAVETWNVYFVAFSSVDDGDAESSFFALSPAAVDMEEDLHFTGHNAYKLGTIEFQVESGVYSAIITQELSENIEYHFFEKQLGLFLRSSWSTPTTVITALQDTWPDETPTSMVVDGYPGFVNPPLSFPPTDSAEVYSSAVIGENRFVGFLFNESTMAPTSSDLILEAEDRDDATSDSNWMTLMRLGLIKCVANAEFTKDVYLDTPSIDGNKTVAIIRMQQGTDVDEEPNTDRDDREYMVAHYSGFNGLQRWFRVMPLELCD